MAGSSISIRETAAGVIFRVRVVPRASRSEVAGVQGDALKLRITAPPVEGKANEECIRLLAETLGVKKGRVAIIAGHASRTKTVVVAGIRPEAVAALCMAG
ncbi:MAG: YggU family protein [Syntrophobacterales bacterium CG_4_8_14_3_um_filter_58_8]|nr:MAG: YggU family protein [Syntrophaceae bacterium CG2_30_58_14]PIV03996.1 MAG: YggU family protein [Syntrophobacterales bacterium CG03_land_8_20_14_0_80_58_14]PJC76118.1 MAG: YggU family protein [Syntrophobacterales bacterium CG_4_8_14_3_um_filter_58_8]